jgi:transcriptional regulator with XRE-family HTH domain
MNRLKHYRREKKLSQVQLARMATISERYYQRLEYETATPNVFIAQRLAAALGVSVNAIYPPQPADSPRSA